LSESIIRIAQEKKYLEIRTVNFRSYADDKHKTTDDRPFGGGPGMVLKVEPIVKAVEEIKKEFPQAKCIALSPQGQPFQQAQAVEWKQEEDIILLCGRYEGFDERIFDILKPIEVSIGDYVLTGGEIPAMVIIESITRLIPGVLGCEESFKEDSFADGLLDHPQYTRPPEFRGLAVPEVLLSGDHQKIKDWRRDKSLEKTKLKRQDLFDKQRESNE